MFSVSSIFKTIRDFLFSRANREFLIFLFFLALSSIFWLLMTLNETYEKEVKVPIHITGVPKDIMLTSNETDTIRATIRDRGLVLLAYIYGDVLQNIEANFRTFDDGNGTGTIPASELNKLLLQQLSASSKLLSVKPEGLTYYYNTGAYKRIPVRWRGRIIPEQLYFLSHVSYSPDSVTVYASEERLDSIRMAYTEPLNHVGFRDTLALDCQLQHIDGVKFVPNRVKVTFHTDVLTEESMDGIPVKCINLPKGKVLRTFPAKVAVRFVTGVNVYRNLTPADFTVVADYNEIASHPSEKCKLYLQQVPQNVTRPALVNRQVDYLIEEVSE